MIDKNWAIIDYKIDKKSIIALQRDFKFKNFAKALAFVNKVGELAENSQHHPDIKFGWGFVSIWLTTHSEGGITSKDHDLAEQIDSI